MFGYGLDPRSFGVAILIRAVGTGKLAVDVNDHAGFVRAGAARVAGEDALAGRGDHARLGLGEEAQRHFDMTVLRLQPERLARQRVEQRAAQSAGGDGEKFAAFHASLPGCFIYLSISASAAQ